MAGQEKMILNLNDDCLISIFYYLDARELVRMEKVCQRFKTVARMTYPSVRELDYDNFAGKSGPIPLLEARHIAQRVGLYVRKLIVSRESLKMSNDFPLSVLIHCKNLEIISLLGFNILANKSVMRLADALRGIKYVDLVNSKFDDSIGICFSNATELEFLDISGNCMISGEFLLNIKTVKHISLSNCNSLQTRYFNQFCRKNPHIESLCIADCPGLDASSLDVIATTLKSIVSISLSDYYSGANDVIFEKLADLPKLTKLDVTYKSFRDHDYLRLFYPKMYHRLEWLMIVSFHAFVNGDFYDSTMGELRYFTKLQALKLYHLPKCNDKTLATLTCTNTLKQLCVVDCNNITPNGLIEFIKKCKLLNYINLSENSQYGQDFLIGLEPYLKKRTDVLELVVTKTPIHECIMSVGPKREFIDFFSESNMGKIDISLGPTTPDQQNLINLRDLDDFGCSIC